MRVIALSILVLSIMLFAVGCVPEQPDVPQRTVHEVEDDSETVPVGTFHQIVLESSQFMPTDLTILRGDSVEWVNKDSVWHTLYIPGVVDMNLPPKGTFAYRFTEAGTHYYSSLYMSEKTKLDRTQDKPDERNRALQGILIVQ